MCDVIMRYGLKGKNTFQLSYALNTVLHVDTCLVSSLSCFLFNDTDAEGLTQAFILDSIATALSLVTEVCVFMVTLI